MKAMKFKCLGQYPGCWKRNEMDSGKKHLVWSGKSLNELSQTVKLGEKNESGLDE